MAAVVGPTILYLLRLRILWTEAAGNPVLRAGRYQPMLRLLSEEDLAPVRENRKLLRRMRAERAAIFRGYLRCLARDYARLLASLRISMLYSEIDRPDLAWSIARNRMMFATTLCRLDVLLVFYRFGIRSVDVSGLIESLDLLRIQTMRSMPAAA
jgi:hypothetical protein